MPAFSALLLGAALAANAGPAAAASAAAPSANTTADGQHDFDFLLGEWDGVQRRLRKRLAGSTEWDEFHSHLVSRPLLGGRANTDQVVFQNGPYAGGATFRLYDPQKQQWSIYWIGSNTTTLDPPVVGRFAGDRAEFLSDDTFEGKPIKVRFLWSKGDLTHCHWEQAFSADGGKTWETNWTVDWTRTAF